jgi:hypothetical protein
MFETTDMFQSRAEDVERFDEGQLQRMDNSGEFLNVPEEKERHNEPKS